MSLNVTFSNLIHYHQILRFILLTNIFFQSLYLTTGRFARECLDSLGLNLTNIDYILDPCQKLHFTATGKWGIYADFVENEIVNIHILIPSIALLFKMHTNMTCGSKSTTDSLRYAVVIDTLTEILSLFSSNNSNNNNNNNNNNSNNSNNNSNNSNRNSSIFGDISSLR